MIARLASCVLVDEFEQILDIIEHSLSGLLDD